VRRQLQRESMSKPCLSSCASSYQGTREISWLSTMNYGCVDHERTG
jgi:hypothetical protein